MNYLSPDTIIGECLETAFNLKAYTHIMEEVGSPSFSANGDFRKLFNGFYVLRQKKTEWYEKYYKLLLEQKSIRRSFENLLREMDEFGSLEVSFISKLIATIEPQKPIWDQYVIRNLEMENAWEKARIKDRESRIALAVHIYDSIEKWYADFLASPCGKECICKFDEVLPQYTKLLTDVKKVDYMLWSKR